MDEDKLNIAVRKFLKQVGVTSQREIEAAMRAGADGLDAAEAVAVRAVITIERLGLEYVVEGELTID